MFFPPVSLIPPPTPPHFASLFFFLAIAGVPCGVTESKVQCKTVSGELHRR